MAHATSAHWIVLGVVMLPLLLADLFVHRGGKASSRKAAIAWSVIWIGAGLAFAIYIHANFGGAATQEYLAAYLIEKSLSLDNLFVFLIIFQSLKIPPRFQHTVLSWGIFGALVFRAIFIFAGVAAIERFHFVAWGFGAILVVAAWRVLREDPAKKKENKVVTWLSHRFPLTGQTCSSHFLTREDGKRKATPLLVAVMALELTDILFAVDSIPAAFAVTHQPFLLYSSNAFAILGLRALYLVLSKSIGDLPYLHYGLAGVLAFAGVKVALGDLVEIPPLISIAIIVAIMLPAVLLSLRARKRRHRREAQPQPA